MFLFLMQALFRMEKPSKSACTRPYGKMQLAPLTSEHFSQFSYKQRNPCPFSSSRAETAADSVWRMQGNEFSFRKFARNRDLEGETRKQRSTKLGKRCQLYHTAETISPLLRHEKSCYNCDPI